MTENQTPRSSQDLPLVPLFHTILAAENKTSELFVKSFQYQGENIATKHLGQIFGFFEIPDTHEDNAYIVNFLASVVKKEYFINPKRSTTDSFEAALHKINLALTELVKQGNTGWLGKLHGVVAVIENNNFHFSVTGDAAILLYRENQVTLISEGLTDKDAAIHPLKTFLEISSGGLFSQDKILLTSPELFDLCDTETLRKNAFRMDKNGFARFVRAALVNESPIGVSIIIDLDPAPLVAPAKKKAVALREESREKLQNVFSSTPFVEKKSPQPEEIIETEETDEEDEIEVPLSDYTDKKTGHIYVQGETHDELYKEPSAWQQFTEEQLRPFFHTFAQTLKRITKKSRKAFAKKAVVIGNGGLELGKNLWEVSKSKAATLATEGSTVLQAKIETLKNEKKEKKAKAVKETTITLPAEKEEMAPAELVIALPEELEETDPHTKRQAALARFSPHYKHPKKTPQQRTSPLQRISKSTTGIVSFTQRLSLNQKLLAGAVGILCVGMFIFLFTKNDATVTPQENIQNTEVPTEVQETVVSEKASPLGSPTTLTTWTTGSSVFLLSNDTTTVVVTPKSLIVNGVVTPFVADGTIEAAAYMPDLKMIFLWSSAKELVSWSLVDKKFTANTLPVPTGAQVDLLGAYLTYLYVLDKNTGSIYRFARTEGGFSEGTSWLKTPLSKDSAQAFVVNDTIRISSTTTDQYLRGVKEKTLSEQSYQVLGSSSQKTYTLGIETSEGKLTIWDADGNVKHDTVQEELKGVSAVTYNEATQKLLVTKDQNLLEYSLSW